MKTSILLAIIAALTLLAAVQYREIRRLEHRISRMQLLESWDK